MSKSKCNTDGDGRISGIIDTVELTSDNKMFGGLAWIVTTRKGEKKLYPGTWAENQVREVYEEEYYGEHIRECSSLERNEQVIFLRYSDIYKEKIPVDGTVIDAEPERKVVWVDWLEGYKDRHDIIPYEDMLAVYNKNGMYTNYKYVTGPSDKLIPK